MFNGYPMTKLLEKVFTMASRLPEREQDELARLILGEIESEERWAELFGRRESADLLDRLGGEALEDHHEGRTQKLDPDDL